MSEYREFQVGLEQDHLAKISRAAPIPALAELIWNALDADAFNIEIFLNSNELGLYEIIIRDDGHGIPYPDSEKLFGFLGGSWKASNKQSPAGRYLHGQEGQGRFKSFSVGRVVDWSTTYQNGSQYKSYIMTGTAENPKKVRCTNETTAEAKKTGTTVKISEPHKEFRLSNEKTLENLSSVFAIYLSKYPGIKISINGQAIDPDSQIEHRKEILLNPILFQNQLYPYKLELIEWKNSESNEFFLCNENGFPLIPIDKRIRGSSGINYSAYLKSEHLTQLNKSGLLGLGDLEETLRIAVDQAVTAIKDYFIQRKLEKSSDKIKKWKEENVYPYKGEAYTPVDQAERQVFDILALNVSEQLPEFEKQDNNSKKFQLRLLRQIVEQSPKELQTIMNEVLNLSTDKQKELADLLEETSISAIITASKLISDRLKFISGLEEIIFHTEIKQALKERSQLHKILAENTWVFGDEFSLSVSDKSLTEVLRKHLEKTNHQRAIDEPVKRIDGSVGIIDLMLTKSIPCNHADEREHLIIELKAPKVPIGHEETGQIKSYAFAVHKDERFKQLKTRWHFWIISNDITEHTEQELKADKTGKGILYQTDEITIWVKTWSQVIQECKHRLEFVRKQLNITLDSSSGLDYLREKYSEYTQGVIFEPEPELAE
ncbi:ATP-binding protein [Pseudomonas chlororaphis]|uniref:ATP-binding protein n=1 Tax=Pseudomonas chlororaphis TaxID=587753 RepID=UPI002368DCD2|nr:ATP-binding protein [Pseudomonas chlororaphis]WDH54166.1 ATP-binding protein [Pseudomonas chlororaphis]